MLKKLFLFGAFAAAAFLLAAPARAHFVWLVVVNEADGGRRLELRFSEAGEPGEAHLVDRVAGSQAWLVDAKGEQSAVTLAKVSEEAQALSAAMPAEAPAAAAAQCLYGVLAKGDKPFDLRYYARYARADEAGLKLLSDAEPLPFDVKAAVSNSGCRVQVLRNGKPFAGAEVAVVTAENKELLLESDAEGGVDLGPLSAGMYSVRAKAVDAEKGERDGKAFEEIRHYATLCLEVESDAAAAGDAEPTAQQLLGRARDHRAVWFKFPGFTSDLKVFTGEKWQKAKLQVSGGGKVTLEGIEDESLLRTLESLVSHRMPGGNERGGVSFADEVTDHPLGRMVKLDYDTAMGSSYRIGDNVIRQVNREMGGGKFTISVLAVENNAKGDYLPDVFSVSFWNKDGTLRSTTTVKQTWTRVDKYDLPAGYFAVTTGADQLDYLRVEFENLQLNAAETSAE